MGVVVVEGGGVGGVVRVLLHVVQGDVLTVPRHPAQSVPQHRSCPTLEMSSDHVPEVVPLHGLVPRLVEEHHALVLLLPDRPGLLVHVQVVSEVAGDPLVDLHILRVEVNLAVVDGQQELGGVLPLVLPDGLDDVPQCVLVVGAEDHSPAALYLHRVRGVFLQGVFCHNQPSWLGLPVGQNIPVVNVGRTQEILHGVDISPEVGKIVWLGILANEVTKLFYLESEGGLWTERQFNSRNCEFV